MESNELERRTILTLRVVSYFVYFFVLSSLVILGLGFILQLFAADPDAGFAAWIYRSLNRIMAPFRGIFPSIELRTNSADVQSVFDTSLLFAMLVYTLVGLAFRVFLDWLTTRIAIVERRIHDDASVGVAPPAPMRTD